MPLNETSRRQFLTRCTSVLLLLIGGLMAAPVVGYVFAPLRRRKKEDGDEIFVDLGPLADLTMGKWLLLPLEFVHQDGWEKVRERHAVFVRRFGDSESQVSVLSPICPHLGCPINWLEKDGRFRCPCHGGTFNVDGACVSGPPPRSMDSLPFKIHDGRLTVRWVDFKIGVSQPVSVEV